MRTRLHTRMYLRVRGAGPRGCGEADGRGECTAARSVIEEARNSVGTFNEYIRSKMNLYYFISCNTCIYIMHIIN